MLMYMIVAGLLSYLCANKVSSSEVSIFNGVVEGHKVIADGRDVWEFLGIPFAEPPIGKLRFRRPQQLKQKWSKFHADRPPKGCLQIPMNLTVWPKNLQPAYSEDCLYLNIWTPTLNVSAKMDVMVWIHGGGFVLGEALPLYNGKGLSAIGNVIVVTIQYRLGLLGFARFDDKFVPGNNGLWDQQMALHWVHNNIGKFGGNPESVTIFGESAGSASVSYHLLNRDSGKYFQRAILLSGTMLNPWAFNANVKDMEILYRQIVANVLKCNQNRTVDLLKCLQTKSEKNILEVMREVKEAHGPAMGPILDGYFITKDPMKKLASGNFNKKDIIIGLTEREGSLFVKLMSHLWFSLRHIRNGSVNLLSEEFVRFVINTVFSNYPAYPNKPNPVALEMVFQLSRSHVDPKNGEFNAAALAETLGQYYFDCGINRFVDAYQKHHNGVYYYELAHGTNISLIQDMKSRPKWSKCTHGDDIPYIFAYPITYSFMKQDMSFEELLLARRIIGDFTNFARFGKPLDPKWRPFTSLKKEFYRIGLNSEAGVGGIKRSECVMWNRILPMVNGMVCKNEDMKCSISLP